MTTKFLEPEDDDGRYTGRFVTLLHWPWEEGLPIPYSRVREEAPATLVQSRIRYAIRVLSPVNKTARVVTGADAFGCPYCSKWFRNLYAMKMHVEERHGCGCTILLNSDLEE